MGEETKVEELDNKEVEKPLTPEEQAFTDEVEELKKVLQDHVDDIVKAGFTIGALDYAADIFKDLMKIKVASSSQYDAFLKEKHQMELVFYSIKGEDLTPYVPENTTPDKT